MSIIRVLRPARIKEFENSAREQARFHLVMAYFWLLTMGAAPFAFPPHDTPTLVQLLILEVSLYANFATEFGALGGSQASSKADAFTETTGATLPVRSDP